MRFTLLGPLRAWRDGSELALGPPKQRALLALLLTQSGQPVSVHEILDVLWGQDPPASAVNVVHRHIGALRRLLDPDSPNRDASRTLLRASGGYRLDVSADMLDLLRFRALCEEARRIGGQGMPAVATELLIDALDLWHGPAASNIAPEVRAHPVFTAIDRERLVVVKEAAETAPAAGNGLTERVLIILRQAAVQHPLDEALQAALIVVLAATGRQAEALDVHRAVRSRLADELGLDPGPELCEAQRKVLRQSASVAGPAAPGAADERHTAAPPYASKLRPAQLPAGLPAFTGRRAELAGAHALLPETDEVPAPVVISAIGGMAGVGKTTLAVHWAHQIAHRFPDGQLYVNLRGFHPTGSIMSPSEAIRAFIEAFGVPSHRVPVGLDGQVALYRSLLAGRRVLVLLDNARDTEQIRPLLPGAPGCLAVVTSRNQLHSLVAVEGACPVTLNLLTPREGREFLTRRLGSKRVEAEPHATDEIVTLCGRLPLALAIVGARAAVNPAFALSSIAEELRETHGSLDAFAGADPHTDARSVFSWSYRALTAPAARLFRLLALHPGPDSSKAAAASLAGLPLVETRALLTELSQAQLLAEHAPGRFRFHELLRAYAAELGREHDPPQASSDATDRLLDHYLHSAHAADTVLSRNREGITLQAAAPGAGPEGFGSEREAVEWLNTERPVLLATIEQDAEHGMGFQAWQLASALDPYLDRHGRWQEQLAVQSVAMTAARRLGDVRGQAHAQRALGFVIGRLHRTGEAREHLLRALELFREIDEPAGQARVHRNLAYFANVDGHHLRALEHYGLAAELYRSVAARAGEGSIHNEVGWTHILLGDYEKAVTECRLAIDVHQETGYRNSEADAWDSLGYAYHHLRRHQQALDCFGHALAIFRNICDSYYEADTLAHMGDTHDASGATALAASAWRQALDIFEALDHRDADPVREKLRLLDMNNGPA